MWVRQCDLDAGQEALPPIPARIASNEEFIPPPQSAEQKQYEAALADVSDRAAKGQGLSRRDFLRTGSGMAAALWALNEVFGPCYHVSADEVRDQKAFAEKWPKDQFIFDVQTHHVDVAKKWYDDTPQGKATTRFFQMLRPRLKIEETMDALNRAHYVKELFGDSDTVMGVISGVPSREWDKNPLPPDQMVATRKYVNDLAGSQRVLSHGLLRPNLGKKELEEMERQVKELKIDAWKMYTGAELGEKAWFLDDEKVAYPFWERTKKLGVKNLCVHKGLPLGFFNEKACMPLDLEKAAKDWPDLNFIVYHSGFRGLNPLIASGTGDKVKDKKTDDPQVIPWVSEILDILRRNPKIKNVYFELGSTFNMTSAAAPKMCMHMLGQMLQVAGADHVLWGTDSIWNGSPQGQIVRFRKLKMDEQLMEKYKYPELTDKIKDQILGLNAAKLFGVDPAAKRQAIKADKLTQLREEYQQNPTPSNTQYGWVWVGDAEPTTPVGVQDV
ncbi:MAG TPA: amidohydrolase family protein [Gemmataceae bacterium]|nr:amidohydrolase family protein [Gemmataceae bacterium]